MKIRKVGPIASPSQGTTFAAGRASLGTRLGLIIGACTLVAMVGATAFFLHQARTEMFGKARNLAIQRSRDLSERIEYDIARSVSANGTTKQSILALWTDGTRDRTIADSLLKRPLVTDPSLFGTWVDWLPDAFDGKDKQHVGEPGSDRSGRYLSYWHRREGSRLVLDHVKDYDRADAEMFRGPLSDRHAYMSEPYYVVQANDEALSVMSYSEPIVSAKTAVGVIGIDVALAPLQNTIDSLSLPADGRLTLVSHAGTIVATTRADLVGTSILEHGTALKREFEGVQAHGWAETTIEDGSADVVKVWFPIRVGTVTTPWYELAEMPVNDVLAASGRGRFLAIVGVLLALFLVLLSTILFAVRTFVTNPLAAIEAYIKNFRQDVGRPCPHLDRTDEIGSIARALAAFQDTEKEVARLSRAEKDTQVKFAATRRDELRHFADQLATTVQAVSNGVEETAVRIMRKAESVAATAIASSEKTKVIAEASVNADASVEAVSAAALALKTSIEGIATEMVEARRLAGMAYEQAESSSGVTVELSAQASRIGEIVALITNIASRTNLLALNATIEAARAGDAGRGFAIVAQEVKALATQTTQATEDIDHQIRAMQETASEAARSLTAISGSVAAVNQISASISRAVLAQGTATSQIDTSVRRAASAAQRVATTIAEVDRATQDTGESAAEMLAESSGLANESARLNDEVLDFIERIRKS